MVSKKGKLTCSSKHSAILEVNDVFVSSSGTASNIDTMSVLLRRQSRHNAWKLAMIKESSILCTVYHQNVKTSMDVETP